MSLGFIYQCYNQDYAFYKCLNSIRKVYPEAPIYIINDGGNKNYELLASKFGCYYKYYEETINVHFPVQNSSKSHIINLYKKYLERMHLAISTINTDYFVRVEDDVKIKDVVWHIPVNFDIIGPFNVAGNFTTSLDLEKSNPCTNTLLTLNKIRGAHFQGPHNMYYFNAGGGCIFKSASFLSYINMVSDHFLSYIYDLNPLNYITIDRIDGVGFLALGFNVGRSLNIYDFVEGSNDYKKIHSCIIHQYKKYYNVPFDINSVI